MSQPPKKQRVRSKNFSTQEVEVLKDEVKAIIHIINAKHCNGSSGITKGKQDDVWRSISEKVNAVGVSLRSVSDIKEKCRNLMKSAKAEVAQQKFSMSRTGGGPAPPKVSSAVADVAELFNNSPAFHGIPGALDAETNLLTFSDTDISRVSVNATSRVPEDSTPEVAIVCSAKKPKGQEQIQVQKKEEKKTLKELQIEYFASAIDNQKQKTILIKEQQVCRLQKETMNKINIAIDGFMANFFQNKD